MNFKIDSVRASAKENRWIILASIFFVAWKFFLISTLWNERLLPPEPDDSFIYILHIDSVIKCDSFIFCKDSLYTLDNYGGFEHLSYRFFFGTLGKIFSLDATTIYHLSFYFGILLLVPVLFFFLRSINNDKNLIAISLFFLALYNGAGSYHGFFWVVPSFYVFLLFLGILSVILDSKVSHWKPILLILIPVSLQTHTLSIYLIVTVPVFFLFYSIISRKFDRTILRKIMFTIILSSAIYASISYYLEKVSNGNPFGIETFSAQTINDIKTLSGNVTTSKQELNGAVKKIVFPGWSDIKDNYFKWLFPRWIFFIPFSLCLGLLFHKKQYKLLALYFSSLFFVIISTLNIYGGRSLIFIWPMTFIVCAYSSWYMYKLIVTKVVNTRTQLLLKLIFFFLLFLFVTVNMCYAFFQNKSLSESRNIRMEKKVVSTIAEKSRNNDKVYLSANLDFLKSLSLLDDTGEIHQTDNLNEADYYFTIIEQSNEKKDTSLETFISTMSRFTGLKRQIVTNDNSAGELKKILDSSTLKRYGDILMYTIRK